MLTVPFGCNLYVDINVLYRISTLLLHRMVQTQGTGHGPGNISILVLVELNQRLDICLCPANFLALKNENVS